MFLAGMIHGVGRALARPDAPTRGQRLCDIYPDYVRRPVLPGDTFGRLRVVERVRSGGAQVGVYWLCVCECGGTREIEARRLKAGDVMHCGCRSRCNDNLVGQTFGLLTVRELHRVAPRGLVWECACACAEFAKAASTYELRAGLVQCCGMSTCKLAVRRLPR
jgi:hypothetical protein